MNFSSLLAGSAIFGFIAAFWGQTKEILWKCVNLIIQRIEVDEITKLELVHYLQNNCKKSGAYDRVYGTNNFIYNGNFRQFFYEEYGEKICIYWKGWFPIIFIPEVQREEPKNNSVSNGETPTKTKTGASFLFVKNTFDIDKILENIAEALNRRDAEYYSQNRFKILNFPIIDNGPPARQGNNCPSTDQIMKRLRFVGNFVKEDFFRLGDNEDEDNHILDHLVLSENIKQLIKEADYWLKSKEWYKSKRIPWRLGWLLYGPPGTGKTMLVKAMAEYLNLPICNFDLTRLNNERFIHEWNYLVRCQTPTIVLFEDFDNIFDGRKNVLKQENSSNIFISNNSQDSCGSSNRNDFLTFDCFLNALDGVQKLQGFFVIITTNNIDKIDPALGVPRLNNKGEKEMVSSRPGRIDKVIEIGYLTNAQKREMAKRFLEEYEDEYTRILRYIKENPDEKETVAQFQEKCISIAIRRHWQTDSDRKEESRVKLMY